MTLGAFMLPFIVKGQNRNDAGLQGDAGAVSGFFETSQPINYPPMAEGWWHLLDVRHTNSLNNYAMQFSGSFFDQQLFFRKTNGSASRPWSKVLLEADGKVGIGTTNPTAGLQLGDLNPNIDSKQILIPGVYNFERLKLGQLGNGNTVLEMVNHTGTNSSYGVRLTANIDAGGPGLQFQYAAPKTSYDSLNYQTGLFMSVSGQIGIGTNTPNAKLGVKGNIRATEIKVENANWPDFVFAKDYQLPTLQETERHIKEKGHLPGIPSATEVKSNGIYLGEMNSKLLQKIEELTLHLINENKLNARNMEQVNRTLEDLRKNNKGLMEEIERLKNTRK